MVNLETEITYLPGVGPKRAKVLGEELGVKTFADLLANFPYKYIAVSYTHLTLTTILRE